MSLLKSVECPTTMKSASSEPLVNSTGISSTSSHRGAPRHPSNPRGGWRLEIRDAPTWEMWPRRRCSAYAPPLTPVRRTNATKPSVAWCSVEIITRTGIRRRGMSCGESNEAAAELGTGTDPGKAGSRGSGARAPGGDAPQWRRTPRLRARMISSSHGRPGFPERKTRRHEGEDRGGGQGSVREGGPTVCRQSWC